MIFAFGWMARMMARMRPASSGVTSEILLRRMTLQNSICWMTRLSISSSPLGRFLSPSPQSNSLCILRASTTVTMQSSLGMTAPGVLALSIPAMAQMVWAIGAGSQMPLASITM